MVRWSGGELSDEEKKRWRWGFEMQGGWEAGALGFRGELAMRRWQVQCTYRKREREHRDSHASTAGLLCMASFGSREDRFI